MKFPNHWEKILFYAFSLGFCMSVTECGEFASGIKINRTMSNGLAGNDNGQVSLSFTDDMSRMVGGHESTPNSHPYIVELTWRDAQGEVRHCAGAILSEEWVITVGQCTLFAVAMEVRAGKHDVSKMEDTEQIVAVTHSITDKFKPNQQLEHDIGLVKVTPKFKFNQYVKPAILPPHNWDKIGMAKAIGWDYGNGAKSTGAKPLQEVDVEIFDNKECEKYYSRQMIYWTSICAGLEEGTKDACLPGSPLLWKLHDRDWLVGLASWGRGCGQPVSPGVYTRIVKYLEYIKKWTGVESDGRLSISSYVAQTLCQQYLSYNESGQITDPIKKRPPSNSSCGWFDWMSNYAWRAVYWIETC